MTKRRIANCCLVDLCRPHDAEEVYVTGTFDNWSKSEKLELVGQVFQKTVALPDSSDKIYYKVGVLSPSLSPWPPALAISRGANPCSRSE